MLILEADADVLAEAEALVDADSGCRCALLKLRHLLMLTPDAVVLASRLSTC